MARQPRVTFTPGAARRIAQATLAVERGDRSMPPIKFRPGGDDGDPVRLGKTTSAWNKGTLATVTLYEEGDPPSETAKTPTADTIPDCVNKFANVASNKWVMIAKAANGSWYLIAAEC